MNQSKLLFLLLLFLLTLQYAYAQIKMPAEINYETAAVGRIVGDSATEMQAALLNNKLDLQHATFFSDSFENAVDIAEVLKKQFPGNAAITSPYIEIDPLNFMQNVKYQTWDWAMVTNSQKDWKKSELFIISTSGKLENNEAKIADAVPLLTTYAGAKDLPWYKNFRQKKPLFLLNAEKAGLFIPKATDRKNSFIGEFGRNSQIISTTFQRENKMLKSIVCSSALEGIENKTGEIFRNARNNYSIVEEFPSKSVLDSHILYGNPNAEITAPKFTGRDLHNYCKGFAVNADNEIILKATSAQFISAQQASEDIYTLEFTFDFNSYKIVSDGNFSWIELENAELARNYMQLLLPARMHEFDFPFGTTTANIELVALEEPEDITLANLPMWFGGNSNRVCVHNALEAGIEAERIIIEDAVKVIARINPVEVLDCTSGKLRLYKKIKYKIDYIPSSQILISDIQLPQTALPNSIVDVNILLKNITLMPISGTLRIIDVDANSILAEQGISGNVNAIAMQFAAPNAEGTYLYRAKFLQNGEVKTFKEFWLNVKGIEAELLLPETARGTTKIQLLINNLFNYSIPISIKHSLIANDEITESGELSITAPLGESIAEWEYSRIYKEQQYYEVRAELEYEGKTKTLIGMLVSNNAPELAPLQDLTVNEGDIVLLDVNAFDVESDAVTITISDPIGEDRFWRTTHEDLGIHTITVTASDGLLADTQQFTITVKPVDKTPPGIGIYSPEQRDYSYARTLDVVFDAVDMQSEVAYVKATLDGNEIASNTTLELPEFALGRHVLVVEAADTNGNAASKSVEFNVVDDIAPVSFVAASGNQKKPGIYTGKVMVELTASDGKSGVDYIEYSLDNDENFVKYEKPIEISGEDFNITTITIFYRALDKSGNKEAVKEIRKITQNTNSSIAYRNSAWFNGEEKIIFDSNSTGNFEIYSMNLGGSDLQQLTFNEFNDFEPAVNADGSKIVFTSDRTGNNDLWLMNIDGNGQIQLTANLGNDSTASWSADNRILFASSGNNMNGIWIMNSDGSDKNMLFGGTSAFEFDNPESSPNANTTAFLPSFSSMSSLFPFDIITGKQGIVEWTQSLFFPKYDYCPYYLVEPQHPGFRQAPISCRATSIKTSTPLSQLEDAEFDWQAITTSEFCTAGTEGQLNSDSELALGYASGEIIQSLGKTSATAGDCSKGEASAHVKIAKQPNGKYLVKWNYNSLSKTPACKSIWSGTPPSDMGCCSCSPKTFCTVRDWGAVREGTCQSIADWCGYFNFNTGYYVRRNDWSGGMGNACYSMSREGGNPNACISLGKCYDASYSVCEAKTFIPDLSEHSMEINGENISLMHIIGAGNTSQMLCGNEKIPLVVSDIANYAEKEALTTCGNGLCDLKEDSANCPSDCQMVLPPIAFSYKSNDYKDIWLRSGIMSKQLTKGKGAETYPSWDPLGNAIAYTSEESGSKDIWLINIDSNKPIRLTSDASAEEMPAWNPNDNRILFVSDKDGYSNIYLMELGKPLTIKIDNTVPQTLQTTDDAPLEWANEEVVVNLNVDANNGAYTTYYRINDENSLHTGSQIPLTESGYYVIFYYSQDAVTTEELKSTPLIRIDKIAPQITINSPIADANYLYTDILEINLNAVDEISGIETIEAMLDGNAVENLQTINPQNMIGRHTFTTKATDKAGNETTKAINFNVIADNIAPETTDNAASGWTNAGVVVTLTAADNLSGVAKTHYSINGGAFLEGNEILLTETGEYAIDYYSVDNAGNVEQTKQSAKIQIDKILPTLAISSPETKDYSYTTNLLMQYSASDEISGLAGASADIDGVAVENSKEIDLFGYAVGKHTFIANATDIAGNSIFKSVEFIVIDDIAPITIDNSDKEWHKSDIAIILTTTDEKSNVDSIHYIVNGGAEQVKECDSKTCTAEVLVDYEDNNNRIEYWAVDEYGNAEEHGIIDGIKLDKTAPQSSHDYDGLWHTADFTIPLNAADPQVQGTPSGLAGIHYIIYTDEVSQGIKSTNVDGMPLIDYEDNDTWVEYWSADIAGNEEAHKSAKEIRLDKTAPQVELGIAPQDKYYTTEPLPVVYSATDPQVQGTPSNNLALNWAVDGIAVENPNANPIACSHTLTLTATDLAGNSSGRSVEYEAILRLVGEAQLKITPETLNVNPGTLTAHAEFPVPYSAYSITGAYADYAAMEQLAGDNMKFRRQDIADALAERGLLLDTHFEVWGEFLHNGQTCRFEGSDDITAIEPDRENGKGH